MVIDTLLPLENRDILLKFDIGVTAEKVKRYLFFNDTEAEEVGTNLVWELVPSDGTTAALSISIPKWNDTVKEIIITVPVGIRIDSIEWTEAATANYPIKWCTDIKTGKKFFPITHFDAVIDANGNKLSSVITMWEEKMTDACDNVKTIKDKLLKEKIGYFNLDTKTNPREAIGYKATDVISFFEGDFLSVPKSTIYPGLLYTVVDEDGNVLDGPAESISYTSLKDEALYVYTSERVSGISYMTNTLALRSGGGSTITLSESAEKVFLADNDSGKTYDLFKSSAAEVKMTEGVEAGFDKVYTFTQGSTVIGDIKIKKDKFASSGDIYTADGDEEFSNGVHCGLVDGQQYIRISLADGDPVYIDLSALPITADDALSATSTNPVQSKVLNDMFDNLIVKSGKASISLDYALAKADATYADVKPVLSASADDVCDKIVFKHAGTVLYEEFNMAAATYTDTVTQTTSGEYTYEVEFVKGTKSSTQTLSLTLLKPVVVLATADLTNTANIKDDIQGNAAYRQTARLTPEGYYSVTVPQNGKVIIAVPSTMDDILGKVYLNGFLFPMNSYSLGVSGYNCYISANAYDMGTLTIKIDL